MKNILLLAAALFGAAACNNAPQTESGAAPAPVMEARVKLSAEQLDNAGIRTGRAQHRRMASKLKVNGVIDVPPQNTVSVSFPLGGYLKSTRLLPGMPVRKGQSIAVLEDPQFIQLQQDYLTGKARLQFLEAEFQRQQELNAGKAGSDKALQQAQADFAAQKIQVKALAEKLLLIGLNPQTLTEDNLSRGVSLYAPIDGFVSAVNVNVGKYVNPTDVLFELVNPRDIHLNLTVFEKDVPNLQVGQRVLAHANDQSDKTHPARIRLISRNLNDMRAVEVHCEFDRPDPALLPGMYMQADIEIVEEDALAVPESGVVRWENRHFVFVQKSSGDFELTEVDTGEPDGGYIRISAKGDTRLDTAELVLENAYALLMKMKNTAEE
ncbi:MAG: efflux RND transporter periplasmic adaptor subunit [Thermoanaerobaculia bacterium]|nr:efflux RND transporter periplasmic adaptor subunit [Thermoanaerobaculia bacterium]